MNSRLSSLILLLHIQESLTIDTFTVTCDELNICAVKGTVVTVRCLYSDINITTGFWFSQKQRTNWRNKDEPEDLTLYSDYSRRVYQWITNNQSRLTIYNLRERDSGEYQLMFIMKDGVKHLSSVTVNLTVTVLQVRINPESTGQRVKLSCYSSCPLTSENKYYWYKNGQFLRHDRTIDVPSSGNTDHYSCSEYNAESSSSVCLSNSSCWGVTYTSRRVCALVGSTVDIHSSYSHPTGYTVEKTYWHLPDIYYDLRKDDQFAGRVKFVGNTLRIKDVRRSDTRDYLFRIITNTSDEVSGYPGVYLTVTDTHVRSSPDPVIDGEKVILSCSTECTLDNKHTYIWYKNGQQVTDGLTLLNKLYLDSINSEELQEYSCTVRGNTTSHHTSDIFECVRSRSPVCDSDPLPPSGWVGAPVLDPEWRPCTLGSAETTHGLVRGGLCRARHGVMQVRQAKALKDQHRRGHGPATKESCVALTWRYERLGSPHRPPDVLCPPPVVQERHLWLCLAGIK
ncbi:sialoadhesin [Misgurnus anguillicaudatus]|uniref:sialoadhesin n=1 Tax=Misgurnus anguillicaudatus TaxID=75329 RepID=UPI003CCFC85B